MKGFSKVEYKLFLSYFLFSQETLKHLHLHLSSSTLQKTLKYVGLMLEFSVAKETLEFQRISDLWSIKSLISQISDIPDLLSLIFWISDPWYLPSKRYLLYKIFDLWDLSDFCDLKSGFKDFCIIYYQILSVSLVLSTKSNSVFVIK